VQEEQDQLERALQDMGSEEEGEAGPWGWLRRLAAPFGGGGGRRRSSDGGSGPVVEIDSGSGDMFDVSSEPGESSRAELGLGSSDPFDPLGRSLDPRDRLLGQLEVGAQPDLLQSVHWTWGEGALCSSQPAVGGALGYGAWGRASVCAAGQVGSRGGRGPGAAG